MAKKTHVKVRLVPEANPDSAFYYYVKKPAGGEKANGFEGQMLTGKAAQPQADVFRSQAEVVAAMQDPRYDSDPAYRQAVFSNLGRSNIQY